MTMKKISTNVPATLLKEAVKLSGLNQTQALIEGLQLLIGEKRREGLLSLKGKLRLKYSPTQSRQRTLVK